MRSITGASMMAAMIFSSPPQFAQCSRSMAKTRLSRHLHGAECLGADVRGATPADPGEVVAGRIIEMMKATAFPNGLTAVGLGAADAGALADGSFPQQRLLAKSPCPVVKEHLASLFLGAMRCW